MITFGIVVAFLLWSAGIYMPLWLNERISDQCKEASDDRWFGMTVVWFVGLLFLYGVLPVKGEQLVW